VFVKRGNDDGEFQRPRDGRISYAIGLIVNNCAERSQMQNVSAATLPGMH
jgi:hypothetical protein